MAGVGTLALFVAFVMAAISAVALIAGHLLGGTAAKRTDAGCVQGGAAEALTHGGRIGLVIVFIALAVCCGVLVVCFLTDNYNIQYVIDNHSSNTGSLALLYKISGLWAGRQGSLLFWTWLIALFAGIVSVRRIGELDVLDNTAAFVFALVLAAFTATLLFSADNMPFTPLDSKYVDSDGTATTAASLLGMNFLLEHWAMAIHPPTLFAGYAGLTVPFAYAIAALVAGDSSREWVNRSTRYLLVSWIFLTIGIGLGAVWAYVCLGWGGYWGWDPVENASLLPWLVCIALIHSFTVYRKRGTFKRWSIMCACLTFAFVIMGTFISRSGLVQSVHAFEGDPVSTALFLALIVVSILAGAVGLAFRWGEFAPDSAEGDEVESFISKDIAYYLNNLFMVVLAVLLAYLTISSALPSWLPFGGETVSAGTYNAIARPIGIVYLAVLAVCPLLSWRKTEGAAFAKRALVPGICAVVVFVMLVAFWATNLLPVYDEMVAGGGSIAEGFTTYGPAVYYHGLAIVGFAVASLLFFNAAFMIGRGVSTLAKNGRGAGAAIGTFVHRCSSICGGAVAHMGMAVILVGLIGSSMYAAEYAYTVDYDAATDSISQELIAGDYVLTYTGSDVYETNSEKIEVARTALDVTENGASVGHVEPATRTVIMTAQTQLEASVIGFPTKDLFVVFNGLVSDTQISFDVKINPLVSFVWVGFFMLGIGALVAIVGNRKIKAVRA